VITLLLIFSTFRLDRIRGVRKIERCFAQVDYLGPANGVHLVLWYINQMN